MRSGLVGGGSLAVLLMTAAAPARADESFRCPTDRLIRLGDPLIEAKAKCGAPSHVIARNEKEKVSLRARHAAGAEFIDEREITVEVEEWFYDLGRNRLSRLLRFENGRLAEITTGQYGSGAPTGAPSAAPDAGAK